MTVPVTGPFLVARRVRNAVYTLNRSFRQKKPYDLSLDHTSLKGVVSSLTGDYPSTMDYVEDWPIQWNESQIPYITVTNRAYAKFVDKFKGEQSELLTLALEAEQSWQMIYARASQLVRFVRAARRGDVGTMKVVIGDAFTPSRHKKVVPRAKKERDAAGLILEHNYGWVPLCGDIEGAVKALVSPPLQTKKIHGAARAFFVDRKSNTSLTGPGAYFSTDSEDSWGSVGCRIGATVRLDNPNLYLLNVLGLLNPALSLYQVTYMSHVVNWFTDLESVMSSWTDHYGVSFIQPYTSTFVETNYSRNSYLSVGGVQYRDYRMTGKGVKLTRVASIVTPRVDLRWGIRSQARALNAISQLIQLWPKN